MKTYALVIRQLGYCCSQEFLAQHSNMTTQEIADKLELSPRTIRLNKQIAREESECPMALACHQRLRQRPQ